MAETLRMRRENAFRAVRPSLSLVAAGASDGLRRRNAARVVIAEGDRLARAGLQAVLDAEADIEVAGSTGDGEAAVSLARQIRPDVVVTDIALPGIDGIELTRQIVSDRRTSAIRVVILSASEDDDQLLSSLLAGASGFLPRDTEPAQLARCVRAAAAGEPVLSPAAVRKLIDELASRPDPALPARRVRSPHPSGR